MNNKQMSIYNNFEELKQEYKFPGTRYQGSKAKLVDWIWENTKDLEFDCVLDLFGGTGCVSHMYKNRGKQVIYNDILKFNAIIGKALIENDDVKITEEDIEYILSKRNIQYPTVIQRNFKGIFYLDEENEWLDMVITNIYSISNEYKRAIAFFALFQACIIKRPYNLFHRANLAVRTKEIERSFGNKVTWDTSFETHFRSFIEEANQAVFPNGNRCTSCNFDAMQFPILEYNPQVIYIDTPYINEKGVGTDYLDFYHFLEGITNYEEWEKNILCKYKHKPLIGRGINGWSKKREILRKFDELFCKYKDYTLIISYRADGIPSEIELLDTLKKYKQDIVECYSKEYKYVLSKKDSKELLIIAK